MSEATTLSKLGEFLGIISRALVSSTYLMRSRQSDSSLFVITVKRITPSLVPWGTPRFSVCNIHIFLSFLGSLLKQCILFEIFLQFSLPPPYTKLNSEKFWIHVRVQHCLWGEGRGLNLCALEIAPETQKCPKTFVHDCRYIKTNIKYNNYSSLPFQMQLLKSIKQGQNRLRFLNSLTHQARCATKMMPSDIGFPTNQSKEIGRRA